MKLKVNCKIVASIVITLSVCSLIFNGIMVNMNNKLIQNQKDMQEILQKEMSAIDTIEHHNILMYEQFEELLNDKK